MQTDAVGRTHTGHIETESIGNDIQKMQVSEICLRSPVFSDPDRPIDEVAALMRNHHTGAVVVVRDRFGVREPIGVITERDLVVEVMSVNMDPRLVTAGDIILSRRVSVPESATIAEAVGQMRRHALRRVPVVDARGDLVGLLRLQDIAGFFAASLGDMVDLMQETVTNGASRGGDRLQRQIDGDYDGAAPR